MQACTAVYGWQSFMGGLMPQEIVEELSQEAPEVCFPAALGAVCLSWIFGGPLWSETPPADK